MSVVQVPETAIRFCGRLSQYHAMGRAIEDEPPTTKTLEAFGFLRDSRCNQCGVSQELDLVRSRQNTGDALDREH